MQALDDDLIISAFSPPPGKWHALEYERDRLRLLLEVSESIASHRDVAALFQDLAQRLPRIVPFDYINVVLYDPVHKVMRLHLLVVPETSTFKPEMELPIDQSPAGWFGKVSNP
jgi:formate hydrogenlyase transcriptional activator